VSGERAALRAGTAAALLASSGVTSLVVARVYKSRTTAIPKGSLPQINVYVPDDIIEQVGLGIVAGNRRFTLQVEAWVDTLAAGTDGDANLDDQLDTLSDAIETALFGSQTWLALVQRVSRVARTSSVVTEGDRRRALVVLSIDVTARVAWAPTTSTTDLDEVVLSVDKIEHATSAPDDATDLLITVTPS
jgi:hypothetical protein